MADRLSNTFFFPIYTSSRWGVTWQFIRSVFSDCIIDEMPIFTLVFALFWSPPAPEKNIWVNLYLSMLKCALELRGTADLVINLCGFCYYVLLLSHFSPSAGNVQGCVWRGKTGGRGKTARTRHKLKLDQFSLISDRWEVETTITASLGVKKKWKDDPVDFLTVRGSDM